MTTPRIDRIRERLLAELQPTSLHIEDESHLHRGHAGAASGKGHYRVQVVSAAFAGKSLLTRHRLVYAALDDLMQTDIHALSVQAQTPDELSAPADYGL
jgi:BolA protein